VLQIVSVTERSNDGCKHSEVIFALHKMELTAIKSRKAKWASYIARTGNIETHNKFYSGIQKGRDYRGI
jgi:hypothetical protein